MRSKLNYFEHLCEHFLIFCKFPDIPQLFDETADNKFIQLYVILVLSVTLITKLRKLKLLNIRNFLHTLSTI